jgi:hypothetical protein
MPVIFRNEKHAVLPMPRHRAEINEPRLALSSPKSERIGEGVHVQTLDRSNNFLLGAVSYIAAAALSAVRTISMHPPEGHNASL